MSSQVCEHKNCLVTHHTSTHVPQKDETCYICNGYMTNVGLLRGCDHVSCADCLRKIRNEDKIIKCPQCSLISYTAIYSTNIFTNNEKNNLFTEHLNCLFGGDPIIKEYLSDLNSDWLTLIEMMASSEGHGRFKAVLHADGYSKELDADVLHVGSNHAKFRLRQDGSHRVVIFCLIPNCLCLRVVLSPRPLFKFDEEDDYADEAVRCFNEQLLASWKAFPYIFREGAESCIMSRRFDKVHCAFKFRLLKFCPFKRLWKDVPDGVPVPMRDQLLDIRLQNFKFTWRDVEKMLEGKFDFKDEVEGNVFPLLHD